jgi:hypothetical protein
MKPLDHVLDALNRYHQRATYGAVAEVVGATPQSLMTGRPRDRRHSWVVNRKTGKPTEYSPSQVHPNLTERQEVLSSGKQLQGWLDSPR